MSLKTIIGQDRAVRRLKSLLSTRAVPPALVFSGSKGVGKATCAVRFAKALNCDNHKDDCCDLCQPCSAVDKGISPDMHLVDAAYQAGLLEGDPAKQRSIRVDTVRHVIGDLEMRSLTGRWKAAIVDQAHTLVIAAANAMLKSLEEPPPRTVWILVTDRPNELLPTIRSRCQTLPFSPLAPELIVSALIERGVPRAEAETAAPLAEGSLGRALEILEQDQPHPSEWIADPLAPFQLAEALPRGLHLSRPLVEDQIHRMAWHIRRSLGPEGYSSAPVRTALRELARLRRALKSNVDPRIVLELAAFRLQHLHSAGSLPS
ncbi:ATP-binding protein [Elusimicrobiota bacterium]